MSDINEAMSGARPPGARSHDARVGLHVELRRTVAGRRRHVPTSEHHISLHSGAPVRISCAPTGFRCVRSRGEFNVIPAGTAEDWFEDDVSETVEVRLPASLVRLAAEEMGRDPDRAGIVSQCHARDAQIEHIGWALAAEHQSRSANGLLYRESLGLALAVHLLTQYPAPASAPAIPRVLSRAELTRVTEYIEAHLDQDVSLLRLARVCGVSASHLRALFKRALGVPVHEYVIQRRVERARTLLLRGDLPASQVALDAGFSHQSHMARCMRRVLGVTPTSIARSRGSRPSTKE
jgi:AraC family transcriptional regulator